MNQTGQNAAALNEGPAPTAPANRDWLEWLRTKVLALTAIVVASGALINAVWDIYVHVQDLPKTDAQEVNLTLTEKYLHSQPVAINTISIKTSFGSSDAVFYIYDGGDINVEYAGKTQWFALAKPDDTRQAGWSLMSSAYAQPAVPAASAPVPARVLSFSTAKEGSTLVRKQTFSDGTVLTTRIDARTGNVLGSTRIKLDPQALQKALQAPAAIQQERLVQ